MSSPFSENPYQTPQAPLGPPPYYPSPFRSPRNCTEAIAALVCSIAGLFVCGILVEPMALVLSIVALKKIRADPYLQGRGMAIAGMVISIVVLVLSILWLLFVFGIFFWRMPNRL
jgi:peptidyl-prolyl cis-trans isomerase B (cyclophilin B)